MIILIEKYNINEKFYFINYELFFFEIKKTISLMTGKIQINVVDEILKSIEVVEEDINELNDNKENENDEIEDSLR